MIRLVPALGLLALTACAMPAADRPGEPPVATPGTCDADAASALVGQTATQMLGGEALQLTGAASLRWIYPGAIVTKDYRTDRLNVEYDDAMVVERLYCG